MQTYRVSLMVEQLHRVRDPALPAAIVAMEERQVRKTVMQHAET
jgi:hypothetical protein